MNDQELAARAREAAAVLFRRADDLDRLAAGLLKELADRLEGQAAAQATEAGDDDR